MKNIILLFGVVSLSGSSFLMSLSDGIVSVSSVHMIHEDKECGHT